MPTGASWRRNDLLTNKCSVVLVALALAGAMNRDIESGEPEAAAPAASGDKARVRDKEYKLRTTEENQQVAHCEKRAPRNQSSFPLALTPHGALEKLHFMPFRCLMFWR